MQHCPRDQPVVGDARPGLEERPHVLLEGKTRRRTRAERGLPLRYMLESFRALYGKTVTVQWHFGNGPGKPATSFHMSCEGFRQGNAPATVYFNVLAARVYRKQLRILDGMGVLFAVADDVKLLGPPEVIAELVEGFSSFGVGRGRPHHAGYQKQDMRAVLRPSELVPLPRVHPEERALGPPGARHPGWKREGGPLRP